MDLYVDVANLTMRKPGSESLSSTRRHSSTELPTKGRCGFHSPWLQNDQCCAGGVLVYDALGGELTTTSDIDTSMGSIPFETEEGIG